MYSVQPAYSLVFPAHRFFPADLSEISSLAFFHLLCYNPNRLTECSMRGSALVLRSIQLLDDEDQIARESVFRAERIPERIDRPMLRIHVRGLSAFCLKVIFTACCRRHAFFFIRLYLQDLWQLNAFYFILFGTLTLPQRPDHWRILKLFHRISRCPILSAENIFCPDGLWRYYIMRKFVVPALSLALCLGLTAGCSSKTDAPAASTGETTAAASAESTSEAAASAETKSIDSLKIAFSPYADADTITTATEPLENLLKETLLEKGYDVKDIDMTVGTSYTAVGEALSAGSADIGFISGGNYVLFSDDCDVLLTALRYAINKDSEDPKEWNDGTIEENTDKMSTYYRSIILAGPSEKGQELLAKVNNGEELTWDDLNSATWAVMGPTSASGYIYPSLWLNERYRKTIADLANAVQSDSYTTSLARLASGQADLMVSYGHIRTKYAPDWKEKFGGTDDMVKQTGIIGVTEGIYNDMIAYSKTSELMQDADFRQALGDSFIEIAGTDEGKDIIKVFSQVGYEWGDDANYDGERAAQEMLKSMN